MKVYFDAVPFYPLELGKLEIDVFRSEQTRPLCQHIIDKHEILKEHLLFNQFSYYVYRRTRYIRDTAGKNRYELLDVPFEPFKYFGGLNLYDTWNLNDKFTVFLRSYHYTWTYKLLLVSTCMECGRAGFGFAEMLEDKSNYMVYSDNDRKLWDVGFEDFFTVPKIGTIDEVIKERFKGNEISEKALKFLGKKVYVLNWFRRFRDLDRMWIIKRNGDENEI